MKTKNKTFTREQTLSYCFKILNQQDWARKKLIELKVTDDELESLRLQVWKTEILPLRKKLLG